MLQCVVLAPTLMPSLSWLLQNVFNSIKLKCAPIASQRIPMAHPELLRSFAWKGFWSWWNFSMSWELCAYHQASLATEQYGLFIREYVCNHKSLEVIHYSVPLMMASRSCQIVWAMFIIHSSLSCNPPIWHGNTCWLVFIYWSSCSNYNF